MKKILHIIDSLGVGGAEKLLVGIINDLEEFENHLLILKEPAILKTEFNHLASFTNLHATSFRNALTKVPAVKKIMKEGKFDIVHSHLYESNIIARLAAPKQTKLFNSIHAVSSLASYNDNKLSLWLEKLTYKKKHHLVHVSQTVSNDFDRHIKIKGPSTVLYNFIEEAFFKIPKNEFCRKNLKLVAVGNLRHQKNYPYLIEAFKQMPRSVSLDVYGEGPLRKELQSQIDKAKLNIYLKGIKNDLYNILPQYDLFIMSSHFEGQPVALLEAMACGLPALLSDIPVLREVGNGFAIFFDLRNPGSLVEKIIEIMNEKHNLPEMSAKGFEFAQKHAGKDNYIKKLKSLYESNL